MTKRSNSKFVLGLAVAFLLPLSFYFIAKGLSKDKIDLPDRYNIASTKEVQQDGKTYIDTIYHAASDLALVNQLGDSISLNTTLQGKILVLDFIRTTDETTAPKLAGNMWLLQKAFRRNPKLENGLDNSVQFVSISLQPDVDSFQQLRAFAERFKADHDHWWFANGNIDAIRKYILNELKLTNNNSYTTVQNGALTSTGFVLLDAKRVVRGFYNGLDTVDVKRCADDVVLLTMEKEKKRR